jgi:hypothetical protein
VDDGPEPSPVALNLGQRGQDVGRIHCKSPRRSIRIPAGVKANCGQGRAYLVRGEYSYTFVGKTLLKVLDDGVAKLGREN